MFGLGPLEMLVLGLLAFMLFGEKLPELAKDAARLLHQVRTMADGATKGLREELGPEYADLDLRDLHPKTIIQKHVMDAVLAEEQDSPMRTPVARPSTPVSTTKAPTGPTGPAAASYDTDAT